MSDFSNIPELVRDYEIGQRLGEGGYGVVVKAFHKRLRKTVVIKESKLVVSEEKARAEVDILKNLHHPNLPQVYDFFIDNGKSYTVMDFIDGESVGSMLKRRYRFSKKEVYKYSKQLLMAVDYLHSRRIPIIHGDIKPDNIMITPDGNLCLIDFNISGVSDGHQAYTTGFSPGYGSPEQEKGFMAIAEKILEIRRTRGNTVRQTTGMQPENTSARRGNTEILKPDAYPSEGSRGSAETEQLIKNARDNGEFVSTLILIEDDPSSGASGNEAADNRVSPPNRGKNGTELLAEGYVPDNSRAQSSQRSSSSIESYGIKLEIPIDKRSDIYSAGATIYHMYTGEVYDRNKSVALKADVSESFVYVMNKSLQVNPDKRFQNGGEMLKAIDQIYKKDRSYRGLVIRTAIFRILLVIGIVAGITLVREGGRVKKNEKENEYDSLVHQLETKRTENDQISLLTNSERDTEHIDNAEFEEFDEVYNEARKLLPEREDAYLQRAMWLYENGAYGEDADFIFDSLQEAKIDFSTDTRANMYQVLGNCYYELGYLEEAAAAFENSIECNKTNANVYIDYAVTLAGLGQEKESDEVLQKARAAGVKNDLLLLTQGEIGLRELAKKNKSGNNIEFAENVMGYFVDCMAETSEEYLNFRACMGAGKTYDWIIQGMSGNGQDSDELSTTIEKRISLFEKTANKLPVKYRLQLYENMVQYCNEAYLVTHDKQYDDRATTALNSIIETGYATMTTYENICNIYRRQGDYNKTLETLSTMEQRYAGNYRVYLIYALTCAEMQSSRDVDDRDYSEFCTYYGKARSLYDSSPVKDDMEMEGLDRIYADLQSGGWITE